MGINWKHSLVLLATRDASRKENSGTRGEEEGLLNKDVNYQAHVVGKVQRCIDTTDNLLRISKELWEKMPSGALQQLEDSWRPRVIGGGHCYLPTWKITHAFFYRFEGLDGLEVKEGLPAERVWQPDQVLVRVHASSVEPLDVSILRSGQ